MPYPTNPEWKKKYGDYKATPQLLPSVTNAHFADGDRAFNDACQLAGVKPTACQAKKFRKQSGSAYKAMKEAEQSKAREVG